jgi:hypothetical protein
MNDDCVVPMYYPNQEQHFNSMGIYDLDNDLRMFISLDAQCEIEEVVHEFMKTHVEQDLYDGGNVFKDSIFDIIVAAILKHDIDYKTDNDWESIQTFVESFL